MAGGHTRVGGWVTGVVINYGHGRRAPSFGMIALLLLTLAGCAPSVSRAATARVSGPVAFYPHQTGLSWRYLPTGSLLNTPRYTLIIDGPTYWQGRSVLRFSFSGRGQERDYYREIGPGGVWLSGFAEPVSNSRVTFSPPLEEYPPAASLAPGFSWSGKTKETTTYTSPDGNEQVQVLELDYTYTVRRTRTVRVPAGTFMAYIIQFQVTDLKGQKKQSEIWFVPHMGEVRTQSSLVLVEHNFSQ